MNQKQDWQKFNGSKQVTNNVAALPSPSQDVQGPGVIPTLLP